MDSLPARLVAVVRSPRALFAAVIARPRWLGVMLVSFAAAALSGVALMQTAVGQQALVDQWERTALAFGGEVDDATYAGFQQASRDYGAAYAALNALVSGPILTFALAGVIAVLFGRRSSSDPAAADGTTYTQALAVVAHAGVMLALRQVVTAPVNYARETLASPLTLGRFFPMFDEASPPARFFGVIDLFVVWWVVVLAIGVALLYRRPAPALAWTFLGAYAGLAALLAIVMAVSGGTV